MSIPFVVMSIAWLVLFIAYLGQRAKFSKSKDALLLAQQLLNQANDNHNRWYAKYMKLAKTVDDLAARAEQLGIENVAIKPTNKKSFH